LGRWFSKIAAAAREPFTITAAQRRRAFAAPETDSSASHCILRVYVGPRRKRIPPNEGNHNLRAVIPEGKPILVDLANVSQWTAWTSAPSSASGLQREKALRVEIHQSEGTDPICSRPPACMAYLEATLQVPRPL
jgi:hypothetical protein